VGAALTFGRTSHRGHMVRLPEYSWKASLVDVVILELTQPEHHSLCRYFFWNVELEGAGTRREGADKRGLYMRQDLRSA